MTDSNLNDALKMYLRRNDLKSNEVPVGTWTRNRLGGLSWIPGDQEKQKCCEASALSPQKLNLHCRSAEHVANLYCVSPTELAQLIDNYFTSLEVKDRLLGSNQQDPKSLLTYVDITDAISLNFSQGITRKFSMKNYIDSFKNQP